MLFWELGDRTHEVIADLRLSTAGLKQIWNEGDPDTCGGGDTRVFRAGDGRLGHHAARMQHEAPGDA